MRKGASPLSSSLTFKPSKSYMIYSVTIPVAPNGLSHEFFTVFGIQKGDLRCSHPSTSHTRLVELCQYIIRQFGYQSLDAEN
jgi:hypothetical protein